MNIEEKRKELLSILDGLTFTEIYETINYLNLSLGNRFIDMSKWNNAFIGEKLQMEEFILEEPRLKEIFVSDGKESKVTEMPTNTFNNIESLVKQPKRKYIRKDIIEPKKVRLLPKRIRKDFIHYPENGNWPDKVFYAATCFRRPFKAREAADILLKKEDSIAPDIVIQRVGAYCSQLATGVNPIFGINKAEDGSATYYLLEDEGNNTKNNSSTDK